MKFLDSKEISVESGGVAVLFKPVTPINQGMLLGYQNTIAVNLAANDTGLVAQAKFRSVCYALEEMTNQLTIKGEEFDPEVVGATADITDPDTIGILNTIYDMVVGLLVKGETKKKSPAPRKPTKKAKGAKGVQGQTAA